MAYEEYLRKAILAATPYEKLPEAVTSRVPYSDWKARVRGVCIQKGLTWNSCLAKTVCSEQDYYEQLIQTYKAWARVYPYHMSDYICRVQRITPFKYYNEVLFLTLKDEKSYDRIPNFTAADILRVTGIGRNQYIALMNACKAKKLMWRVNKGIARDLLPNVPQAIALEPWWGVQVVNVGESEWRELSSAEVALLRQACEPPAPPGGSSSSSHVAPPVSQFDAGLLQGLYRRGLIYLDIPVAPEDRLSLPPLEGFVSNKTSEAGDAAVDPLEPLLYSLFLANSSRVDQARLADILNVELQQLLLASSLAVRLGFATRIAAGSATGGEEGSAGVLLRRGVSSNAVLSIPESDDDAAATSTPTATAATGSSPAAAAAADGVWADDGTSADGGAVAVVVDAEATSYLMMGALSPGLKRHSVTLFEGGRVGGAAVIDELIAELAASAAAGAQFEGDMVQLMQHIESLGILLGVVRAAAAAQGQQLELLRKESLEGLDPASAAKVLRHAYTSIVPISPLRGSALPLNPLAASSPTLYGPTPEAASPWLQLALYAAAAAGPVSLVCVAGTRVWRLPSQLEQCTHALVWGWHAADGWATGPLLVEGSTLLCTLNELLTKTAVMVQPLVYLYQLPSSDLDSQPLVSFVDVPLPLRAAAAAAAEQVAGLQGTRTGSGELRQQQQQVGAAAAAAADIGESLLVAVSAPSAAAAAGEASSSSSSMAVGAQQQQQQQQRQPPGDSSSRGMTVLAIDRQHGSQLRPLHVPANVVAALQQVQLSNAVGWLRLVTLPPARATSSPAGVSPSWVPLSLNLGVPLFCPVLCRQVCQNMTAAQCLSPGGQASWRNAQQQLQQQLWELVVQYGAVGDGGSSSISSKLASHLQDTGALLGTAAAAAGSSSIMSGAAAQHNVLQAHSAAAFNTSVTAGVTYGGVELPACALLFDGSRLVAVDVGECVQGVRLW